MRNPVLKEGSGGLYPIRTLASMTGVNPVTLRAWERRYGLLSPVRTPKGHRLYDDADVDLVRQIVGMLESGIPISRAASIVRADEANAQAPAAPAEENDASVDVWASYAERMRRAIRAFNEDLLDAVYNEVLALYPTDVATERLVIPLLQGLGERWQEVPGGIAEEHFFSVYLRNKIGARFHHLGRVGTGPKLVCACLPEELHDTGLLLFGVSAATRGYRLVQLGAGMPLEEVAIAAQRTAAAGVVLSGAADAVSSHQANELRTLSERLKTPVFVGGELSVACADELASLGLQPLGRDLGQALRTLDAVLGRNRAERAAPDEG